MGEIGNWLIKNRKQTKKYSKLFGKQHRRKIYFLSWKLEIRGLLHFCHSSFIFHPPKHEKEKGRKSKNIWQMESELWTVTLGSIRQGAQEQKNLISQWNVQMLYAEFHKNRQQNHCLCVFKRKFFRRLILIWEKSINFVTIVPLKPIICLQIFIKIAYK